MTSNLRIGDIGCGHALIDLEIYRHCAADIVLIDIERTDEKHHEFRNSGAGYASLLKAVRFLTDNGVPPDAIATCNPRREPLPHGPFDYLISLISAGFHYPIDEYADYALKVLRPGGALIFDIRDDTGQEKALEGFTKVREIGRRSKSARVAAIK